MKTYLILQHPGHNRVYYNLSGPLALAELKVASTRLNVTSSAIEIIDIEGIRYLSLTTEDELTTLDLELLSRLSFVFALFDASPGGCFRWWWFVHKRRRYIHRNRPTHVQIL